jgi:hypothetical protein
VCIQTVTVLHVLSAEKVFKVHSENYMRKNFAKAQLRNRQDHFNFLLSLHFLNYKGLMVSLYIYILYFERFIGNKGLSKLNLVEMSSPVICFFFLD